MCLEHRAGRALESERFAAVRIVLFATLAAIVYGITHDEITAHLCVEYFTIAHPPVFPTRSPLLLGLGWGVIATWWFGLTLGIGLAAAARLGGRPKIGLAGLRRPILLLMLASALSACVAGIAGGFLCARGNVGLPGGWGQMIALDRQAIFSAVAWAHVASYAAGGVGGLIVIGFTIRRRGRTR